MTIGEKIKCFRTLNHMTQKSLGEACGIGEATIRKYELGIRNPKQEQIRKIAKALHIGENLLMDLPFSSIDIATVGDAMALFLLLEERLGVSYTAYKTLDGTSLDATTISIKFDNNDFNHLLAKWIYESEISKNQKALTDANADRNSTELKDKINNLSKAIAEETKLRLISDKTPL